MADRTDFSTRIARIEARASGKLPPMPVIAPMVGEEWNIQAKPRRRLRRLLLPLALLAVCGIYSDRLIALLPQAVLEQSEFLSGSAAEGSTGPATAKSGL